MIFHSTECFFKNFFLLYLFRESVFPKKKDWNHIIPQTILMLMSRNNLPEIYIMCFNLAEKPTWTFLWNRAMVKFTWKEQQKYWNTLNGKLRENFLFFLLICVTQMTCIVGILDYKISGVWVPLKRLWYRNFSLLTISEFCLFYRNRP
jgi:hypothetical protein